MSSEGIQLWSLWGPTGEKEPQLNALMAMELSQPEDKIIQLKANCFELESPVQVFFDDYFFFHFLISYASII